LGDKERKKKEYKNELRHLTLILALSQQERRQESGSRLPQEKGWGRRETIPAFSNTEKRIQGRSNPIVTGTCSGQLRHGIYLLKRLVKVGKQPSTRGFLKQQRGFFSVFFKVEVGSITLTNLVPS
jgi:hypothetical protein